MEKQILLLHAARRDDKRGTIKGQIKREQQEGVAPPGSGTSVDAKLDRSDTFSSICSDVSVRLWGSLFTRAADVGY